MCSRARVVYVSMKGVLNSVVDLCQSCLYTVRNNAHVHVCMLPHPLTIQHSTHIDPHMLMCTMSNVHAHYVKCESINQTGIPACTHINPCNIQLRCGYECAYDWILQPICPGSHIHVPVNGQSLYLVPIYIQPYSQPYPFPCSQQ